MDCVSFFSGMKTQCSEEVHQDEGGKEQSQLQELGASGTNKLIIPPTSYSSTILMMWIH